MMIDSPDKPGDALKLKAEIARRGRLRFIINTEPHGDHWTGNAFFDVPVIAREGGRTRILNTDTAQHLARVASFGPEKPKLLKGLGTLDEEVFVPGHGAVCDKSYLDEQGEYISMPCPGACQFSAARLG
jgi:glyoxylase-like metal-dependent hydrolase (beta-lactamase superfamily II)